MRRSTVITLMLLAGIIVIMGFALVIDSSRITDGQRFVGTDTAATKQVEQDNPDYKPWFSPVFAPSSSEIESGLFALQAALGAGALGYTIGVLRGRRRTEAALAEAALAELAARSDPR